MVGNTISISVSNRFHGSRLTPRGQPHLSSQRLGRCDGQAREALNHSASNEQLGHDKSARLSDWQSVRLPAAASGRFWASWLMQRRGELHHARQVR